MDGRCATTWHPADYMPRGQHACLRAPTVADTLSGNVRSFSPARAAVVRTGVVFVAIAAATSPVYAQTSGDAAAAPGDKAMQRARSAWDGGDFDLAPGLYKSALEAGGLRRADVVDAYVRMGSAYAVVGKKKPALAAFRQAALLDPSFTVPPEAGKKATSLAERARRDQRRVGALAVSAQTPDEVKAGASFAVDVALAPSRAPLIDSVHLEVRDSLAGRAFEQGAAPESRIHFDVPVRMTLPDASLLVRVRVLDAANNELQSFEKHVHVQPAVAAPLHPAIAALRPRAPGEEGHRPNEGGGFWNTAWPYVIGGAALAAGGAAVYFGTRPTADVNVGAVRVELAH